jgi:hypothetical protein
VLNICLVVQRYSMYGDSNVLLNPRIPLSYSSIFDENESYKIPARNFFGHQSVIAETCCVLTNL